MNRPARRLAGALLALAPAPSSRRHRGRAGRPGRRPGPDRAVEPGPDRLRRPHRRRPRPAPRRSRPRPARAPRALARLGGRVRAARHRRPGAGGDRRAGARWPTCCPPPWRRWAAAPPGPTSTAGPPRRRAAGTAPARSGSAAPRPPAPPAAGWSTATTAAAEPDGVAYVRCGNRRAAVCPSCSHEYQGDMWHLLYAGTAGGIKDVPDTIASPSAGTSSP